MYIPKKMCIYMLHICFMQPPKEMEMLCIFYHSLQGGYGFLALF